MFLSYLLTIFVRIFVKYVQGIFRRYD